MRIDFHSHILPKMDDGSSSSQESIEMLTRANEQGVKILCLTPHFYPEDENPDSFIKRRDAAFNRLITVCEEQGFTGPRLFRGAEVAWFTSIGKSEEVKKLCLGNTNIILVEMPFAPWNNMMIESLVSLKEELDLQPVLAHIDRYFPFVRREALNYLVFEKGIWLQVNAESINNPAICEMIKNNMISFVGSDAHNTTTRPVNIGDAYDVLEEKGLLDKLRTL